MNKIKVLIADNYKLNRDAWAFMLNSDPRFEVIAECSDADKAVELASEKRPDVVLMNINIPVFAGLEATQKIRRKLPASHVIGISIHSQPSYAKKMIQMGAKGYVTKNSSREEMIQAILEVNKGNKYICEEIKNILSFQLLDQDTKEPGTNSISKRELEIINLLKEGLSSKEIAETLFISFRTVEVHRHNILKKLKLKNTASLVNFINSSAMFF
ncbi:MAG: response regulator transcription factor [Bacteroidetes bacterium]|nr:response regulator transcription factor [Bacteroidota bacterium]MBS1932932.1 response regulator transcription factor [Bacteroidota bacterium]